MGIKRREFLGLTALGATGALLWQGRNLLRSRNSSPLAAPIPEIYRSEGGSLEINLEARYEDVILGGEPTRNMMTYNGQIPGPRLEVRPGDRLIIHFKNSLDQPTNLHFHGLHLSPEGNQDNVFLHIEPGETFHYELEIHPQQRAGTYWYHPHHHGFVAEQLFQGLAGLIVVRGDLDELPEIRAAQEEFFVLQDFNRDRPPQGMMGSHMNLMAGREGNLITVNGLFHPEIAVTKDLVRLRLLNASPSRFYRLQLYGQKLMQIAGDDGAFSQPLERDELLLTPGQRAEVLIKTQDLPKTPIHLLNLPYQRAQIGIMGQQYNNATVAIADFTPSAPTFAPVQIPAQLIPVEPLPEPSRTRRFTLNHGMVPGQGMAFLINGEAYRDQPQTTVRLNDVEDWEIVNTGTMDHPFHVHVNGFQVVSRNGVPEENIAWADTVLVRVGETVKIRIAFRDFAGKTVYHCHILDHEDLGMMGQLEILPAS
ncbi:MULTISPECIES: multicopper oxidase family protein [Cyanophyceae]|uniref:multicopper oxidase family protein n=1 Tax=Cyanophyceae TaxID=3028117 RepID=UPI00016DCB69|nr:MULTISPECIES: multicopper oxidase family protein [Cyanophyceae]ACB00297.1 Type 3 multicopper oxidase [Picosynechococcus sp. PCC 7002]SMH52565.1 Multicopper oxidase with three cupredoxin domains (includes cell division protein FtsP and spore coat protein CotA) [Picosynechococcus sp. OG1]SMQ82337.1 Multicopper oxidase with three cupredoxin domains (includes cell division protein FtsP and spore coat protein CotA) [Synechococcus sp. 7002]